MHDIFNNPKLKSIMVLYLMMMGFDLFGRFMVQQPVAAEASKVQSNGGATDASGSAAQGGVGSTTSLQDNGDAIPVDRTSIEEGHSRPHGSRPG